MIFPPFPVGKVLPVFTVSNIATFQLVVLQFITKGGGVRPRFDK